MDGGRNVAFAGEVVGHQTYRDLSLPVWLLIDGSSDGPLLKIRRHLGEKIGRNEFYFSGEAPRAKRSANRQAIDGVYINSGEIWNFAKQIGRLVKTFVFVLVTFDDADHFPVQAVTRKRFGKAVGLLAMVFGGEHTCDDCDLRALRQQFAHQFAS